jgi:RNA 2',3'-cyclic 3'-phosphodiesterase
MRCFVALPLPIPLERALDPLRKAVPVGRAVAQEHLHMTLAFLGEISDAEAETAHQTLELLAARRFSLRFAGLGTFGEPDPHTLWAGVAEAPQLEALHAKVMRALRAAGLELPRRRFRPHVTLARLSRLDPGQTARLAAFLAKWSAFACPEAELTEFALYRSTLGKGAPVYEALASYPLR